MQQNTIKPAAGSTRTRKRVGRGGNRRVYAGRGMNGQNSRSGGGVRVGFEGGQTPLLSRMPKRKGFKNPRKITYFPVNLGTLETLFKDGDKVNVETLVEKGVFKKAMPVKLLGNGELKKKLTITVDLASASAIAKVEKAGGKVEVTRAKAAKAEAAPEPTEAS